jgi:hypothetical protein
MRIAPIVEGHATLADRAVARSMAFKVALLGIHFNLFGCPVSLSRLSRHYHRTCGGFQPLEIQAVIETL